MSAKAGKPVDAEIQVWQVADGGGGWMGGDGEVEEHFVYVRDPGPSRPSVIRTCPQEASGPLVLALPRMPLSHCPPRPKCHL